MEDLDGGLVDGVEEATENHFATVYEFVGQYVVRVYASAAAHQDMQAGVRWCPRWWEHPEAVARLEACWRAFEAMRLDPGAGMSAWFRDHADPCMAVLMSPEGPFSRCDRNQHRLAPPLAMELPPSWLLDHPGSTGHRLSPHWSSAGGGDDLENWSS